ncbi:MTAP family purine nucleoside phosphorylase [Candidatus Micrarchaeota archaeon]|nr:MTAP family purine nucleoside phosphorylase [Candidatus Micrarchaeota archaeon]
MVTKRGSQMHDSDGISAVIAGSGFYNLGKKICEHTIETQYGTVVLHEVELNGKKLIFLPRHGEKHAIPPHKINYKANIAALKKMNVSSVFCVYASGIISDYEPGDLIIVDDFINFWMPSTFYDDFSSGVKHTDFTEPFDKKLQTTLVDVAKQKGIEIKKKGIIATTFGPRFETKAEISALKNMNANLVNMTCGHETPLIHELGIPQIAIAVGTNYACGISKKQLTQEEVFEALEKRKKDVVSLLEELIKRYPK